MDAPTPHAAWAATDAVLLCYGSVIKGERAVAIHGGTTGPGRGAKRGVRGRRARFPPLSARDTAITGRPGASLSAASRRREGGGGGLKGDENVEERVTRGVPWRDDDSDEGPRAP